MVVIAGNFAPGLGPVNGVQTMKMLIGAALVSLAVSAYAQSNANAQGVQVIPGVAAAQEGAANNPPSWQAVCGYKWRQYRQATGASGRDAYTAFMRTPSKDGGCGAGETTTTRKVTAKPNDDRIKEYIDKLGTKVPGVPVPAEQRPATHEEEENLYPHEHVVPETHGELPVTWQDARRGGGRHG